MPLYDMECEHCGPVTDVWAGINEETMCCEVCGGMMKRILSPTRSNPDWQPYQDENLVPMHHNGAPVVVKSRQHRKELMHRLGLVDQWSGI